MSNSVALPWPPKGLSPNSRGHWAQRARVVKAYRQTCRILAMAAKLRAPAEGEVFLRVDYFPPDRRARDWDNIIASSKAMFDGLADAMGVNDKRFVVLTHVHHDAPVKSGRVDVGLEALP